MNSFVKILSFLMLLLLYAEANAANPEVKIGYITDLTSRGAFFGVQSVRGAELARRELERAGVKVKLIIEDAHSNNAEAVTAATKLLAQDQVDAVICDLTPVCIAVSPKVAAFKRPLIYHSPTPDIARDNPHAYRNFIDYTEGCRMLAEYWQQSSIGPVALLAANLPFGEQCKAGLKSANLIFSEYTYNPNDDLHQAALQFKSKGIRAVLHVGYEPDFLSFFQSCETYNYRPTHGMVEIILSPNMQKAAANQLTGATLIGYQPLPRSFEEKLARELPGTESFNIQGAALAYNAIHALGSALKNCPSRELDCIDQQLKQPPAVALMGFSGWGKGDVEYPIKIKNYNGTVAQASSAQSSCESLDQSACFHNKDCVIDCGAAANSYRCEKPYFCRSKKSPCETNWSGGKENCEAIKGCHFDPGGCFCPCDFRLPNEPMCNCACGGGPLPRCYD